MRLPFPMVTGIALRGGHWFGATVLRWAVTMILIYVGYSMWHYILPNAHWVGSVSVWAMWIVTIATLLQIILITWLLDGQQKEKHAPNNE